MLLRELIWRGFGVMNVSKVCGFLPFDGRSDTDNSMVNVFSGECKSESESRIVTVKVKVKLNMVKVTLTIPW